MCVSSNFEGGYIYPRRLYSPLYTQDITPYASSSAAGGARGHMRATTGSSARVDLTPSTVGLLALAIFVFAYIIVMSEEFTHLRKSRPVIMAAGIIW